MSITRQYAPWPAKRSSFPAHAGGLAVAICWSSLLSGCLPLLTIVVYGKLLLSRPHAARHHDRRHFDLYIALMEAKVSEATARKAAEAVAACERRFASPEMKIEQIAGQLTLIRWTPPGTA
jgi:hypothetical protein